MNLQELRTQLKSLADPAIAEHSQGFFKTEKGEYGEGDKFLGVRVPVIRKEVNKFYRLPLKQVSRLLKSKYHEERLCALLILVKQYSKADEEQQKEIKLLREELEFLATKLLRITGEEEYTTTHEGH